MYSLIFNSDMVKKNLYGNECVSKIIKILDNMQISDKIGLSVGDFIFPDVFYDTKEVILSDGKVTSISKVPNEDKIKAFSGELFESIKERKLISSMEEDPFYLVNNNTFIITLINISLIDIKEILFEIKNYKPFVCCFEIDKGNPLHINQFFQYLIKTYIINDNEIFYMTCDDYSNNSVIDELDLIKIKTGVDYYQFCDIFPKVDIPKNYSKRGYRYIELIEKYKNPYNDVMDKIVHNNIKEFSVDKRKINIKNNEYNFNKIIIDNKKIKGYVLNSNHERGKHKALLFKSILDFDINDWENLSGQIKYGLLNTQPQGISIIPYGIRFYTYIPIQGNNNCIRIVKVVWQIDNNSHEIRLITAYIPRESFDVNSFNNIIISKKSKNFFQEVFNLAHSLSLEIAQKIVPTTMYIEGHEPIFEGLCGYAYLEFDGRTKFGKWYKDNVFNMYFPNHYFSPLDTQSYERNVAYMEKFKEILICNGIKSKLYKYYD